MNRVVPLTVVILSLLLVGCVAPQVLSTPSGRPEVTISGVSKDQVVGIIIPAMEGDGFILQGETTHTLVFGRTLDDNLTAKLLYGSRAAPDPEYRVQYTFSENDGALHIICSLWIVSNAGTGHERRQSMNNTRSAHELQAGLETLKARLE